MIELEEWLFVIGVICIVCAAYLVGGIVTMLLAAGVSLIVFGLIIAMGKKSKHQDKRG